MLSNKHPQYNIFHEDWSLIRDCYRGERVVKMKGTTYLPMTASHIMDGALLNSLSEGYRAYDSYRKRARFPNFVREAVQMAIGMMHSQPARIDLPKSMEKVQSSRGETLDQLLRRINTEQLVTGRIGLMVDLPSETNYGEDLPYLSTYSAERMINWDDGELAGNVPQTLNLMVLDESEDVRDDRFNWTTREQYRVLSLGSLGPNEQQGSALYRFGIFKDDNFDEVSLKTPTWRGKELDFIPFVVINSADLTSDVDDPPLLDLANLCMTIYRGDADYRQNLFMQGQDTFVTIGANFDESDEVRVGSGARLDLPTGADAKYVGVKSEGLREQRESLDKLERRAGSIGAQTLDTTSRERESGDSLRIRVAARTADMNQIVEAGAAGLETALKIVATWIGEDPDAVKVTPNKEFGEAPLTSQDMRELAQARKEGFPISAKSMHDLARRRRVTRLTYEEELAQFDSEKGTSFEVPEEPEVDPNNTNGSNGGTNN